MLHVVHAVGDSVGLPLTLSLLCMLCGPCAADHGARDAGDAERRAAGAAHGAARPVPREWLLVVWGRPRGRFWLRMDCCVCVGRVGVAPLRLQLRARGRFFHRSCCASSHYWRLLAAPPHLALPRLLQLEFMLNSYAADTEVCNESGRYREERRLVQEELKVGWG